MIPSIAGSHLLVGWGVDWMPHMTFDSRGAGGNAL